MIERPLRDRRMTKKQFQARIDRIIAEEQRTYQRLLWVRDHLNAVRAAHNLTTTALETSSNIVAIR
jgi:hypothetical protein